MDQFRLVAVIIASGSILATVASCFVLLALREPQLIVIFAPGYAVTVGYLVRALRPPSRVWRRRIWKSSAIVQGAWLILALEAVARWGSQALDGHLWILGWLAFATVASFVGLLLDPPRNRQPAPETSAPPAPRE